VSEGFVTAKTDSRRITTSSNINVDGGLLAEQ